MDKERVGYRSKDVNLADISGQLGKLPPQCVDIEEAVLAAILLFKEALHDIVDILSAHQFYKDAHVEIYGAAIALYTAREPIDLLTVTAHLKKVGKLEVIGGAYYLTELTTKVNSSENIVAHARLIIESAMKRELITLGQEMMNQAYEDTTDVFDLIDKSETAFVQISDPISKGDYSDATELMHEALLKYEQIKNMEGVISGVPSGHSDLDRITGGYQDGNLIIVAARPGQGKTALVVSQIRNIAVRFHIPVALFSMEMSKLELENRFISVESEIPHDDIKKAKRPTDEIVEKTSKLVASPYFIDDTPNLTLLELRAKSRRLVQQEKVKIIFVDYLQLMADTTKGSNSNREQEIARISRGLKALAKELNIPVIALSQLSREVEKRPDKRPRLADLRESGSLEADADIVAMLFRAEYYGVMEDDNGDSLKNIGEIILEKNRHGATDNIHMKFESYIMKWSDLEESQLEMDGLTPMSEIDSGYSADRFSEQGPKKDEDLPF